MTTRKISQLPAAAALSGTELIELVQGGNSVKGTVGSLQVTSASFLMAVDQHSVFPQSRRLVAGANVTLTDNGPGGTFVIAASGGGGGSSFGDGWDWGTTATSLEFLLPTLGLQWLSAGDDGAGNSFIELDAFGTGAVSITHALGSGININATTIEIMADGVSISADTTDFFTSGFGTPWLHTEVIGGDTYIALQRSDGSLMLFNGDGIEFDSALDKFFIVQTIGTGPITLHAAGSGAMTLTSDTGIVSIISGGVAIESVFQSTGDSSAVALVASGDGGEVHIRAEGVNGNIGILANRNFDLLVVNALTLTSTGTFDASATTDLSLSAGDELSLSAGNLATLSATNAASVTTDNGASYFRATTGGTTEIKGSSVDFLVNTLNTVGAAGAAAALPATPSGYLLIKISGVNFEIPYYLRA